MKLPGGWGAKMADPGRDVIVFTGDGSYLMLNSDIYSSVLTGHKLIIVVCDNGGLCGHQSIAGISKAANRLIT